MTSRRRSLESRVASPSEVIMPEQQRDLSVGLLEVAQTLTTNLDLSVVLPTILDPVSYTHLDVYKRQRVG